MTIVRLTDMIQHTQFQKLALAESIRKSALYDSGLIVPDAELSRLCLANVGSTFQFEYFNDLADDTPNQSNDDPSDSATGNKITTATNQAVKVMRNNGWGAGNIVSNLSALGDPMVQVAGRIGAYWGRHYDISCINVVRGIIADNIANDSNDMVKDISGVSNGQKITFDALADAAQTAGDAKGMFKIAVMHSSQATVLLKDQVSEKIYDSNGNLLYTAILGWRIIESDNVYNSANVYDTYIFKPGAIGIGFGQAKKPEEIEAVASAGNGEGVETLWSRRHFSIHPYGFDFTKDTVADGVSPTNAEFALAANWNRKYERKRVGLAVLRSKNANSA